MKDWYIHSIFLVIVISVCLLYTLYRCVTVQTAEIVRLFCTCSELLVSVFCCGRKKTLFWCQPGVCTALSRTCQTGQKIKSFVAGVGAVCTDFPCVFPNLSGVQNQE